MAKIAYITAETPYGQHETFVLSEMLALKGKGADLLVIPRDKSKELFHQSAEVLVGNTVLLP